MAENPSENDPNASGSKETSKQKEKGKKPRFIVFVGNLPFSATKEEVKEYFKSIDGLTDFRLLTKKSGDSKGCGFLEFDNAQSQQKSLKFNHTQFEGRKINVEATCGGGGHSEKRKERIATKNKKVNKKKRERPKKIETKNDKNTEIGKTDVETEVKESLSEERKRKRKDKVRTENKEETKIQSKESEKESSAKDKEKKVKHTKDKEKIEKQTKEKEKSKKLKTKSIGGDFMSESVKSKTAISEGDKKTKNSKNKSRKREIKDQESPKKRKYAKEE